MRSRGHLTLLALAIVFGLPFIASWLLVAHPELIPMGGANRGQLISPPVATSLTGAWTLLVPGNEECDAGCRRAYAVAQVVRRALGAESRHVAGPADCRSAQTRNACAALAGAVDSGTRLVIVDPMGNAMMRYKADVVPRDLFKDVQHLIKVSRNWRYDVDQ